MQLDASGRPDESLEVEFNGPLQSSDEDGTNGRQVLSISLQKGQLGANVSIQQSHSASLEVALSKFWVQCLILGCHSF